METDMIVMFNTEKKIQVWGSKLEKQTSMTLSRYFTNIYKDFILSWTPILKGTLWQNFQSADVMYFSSFLKFLYTNLSKQQVRNK